ncbi:MAG TPA: hypothetical protein VI731_08530, partial [Bacteroidia bacterium]|nr:hypothetical protein [Bacteroidia bacterium]
MTKRFTLFGVFCLLNLCSSIGQTPGLIFEPATGGGAAILDPNGDGFVSGTTSGFISDDKAESEIQYAPMSFLFLEPHSDLGPGPNCGFTDYVDSGDEDPTMIYYDGTNVLIRMRLGNALPNSKGYSILIDTDQLFGISGYNADPNATLDNPGFEVEINLQTGFGVYVYNVDGICPGAPASSFLGHTNYQKSVALTTVCNNPDYFYDFFIPFSALASLGITTSTPLRLAITTQMNPQPAICNVPISDLAGSDEDCANIAECYNDIIQNYPPTPIIDVNNGPAPDMSYCPGINAPILAGATSVSGYSTHADGTLIKVFVNASQIGTTTVTSGSWTLSGISPALASGAIVTASATAPGRSESFSTCNSTEIGTICTAPLANGLVSGNSKAICGAPGTGIPGATVLVYYQNGTPFNTGLVSTVDPDGSFLWKCNVSTVNCNSGPNCISNGAYYITQTFGSECESDGVWICIGSNPTTAAPVITSPVLETSNSVPGTSVANATVQLWSGSTLLGITTSNGAGNWTVTPVSLVSGDVLTALAILPGQCASPLSSPVTVTRVTDAPIITGNYCTSGTITSVSGISGEPAGTIIQVYRNAVAHGSATSVNVSGAWTANSGISLVPGDVITARATAPGALQSSASNSITVGNQTTNAVSITTSPIYEGATSVSGTGVNGDLITLYVDGIPVGTTTVSGGVWTVSGLSQFAIYATGEVTATATSAGNCPSPPTPPIIALCILPNNALQVNPTDTAACGTSTVATITVLNTQPLTFYQLYNGSTYVGTSALGNGGSITLSSGTITNTTTLTVVALKIGIPGCTSNLTDVVQIVINQFPTISLVATPASAIICQNDSTNIDVGSSQNNFTYQLKNLATNANVG